MGYREWQKKHPKWPRLMRDLEGRKVSIAMRMETKGGRVFECGEVYKVDQVYRGKLTLANVYNKPVIRGVLVQHVELVLESDK